VTRLPLRARLTLIFASAMAVVLAGTGFLLYSRLAASLDRTLDQNLRGRAADVAALVTQADRGLSESPPGSYGGPGSGFAQVLNSRGRVFDQTPGLPRTPLLSPAQLNRARRATLLVGSARSGGTEVRLLASPVSAQGQHLVIVVGAPLGLRDEALSELRNELLVGGPIALLVASLIGYLVAAAALRPVERMRIRANAISDRDLAERLPVPRTRDEIGRLGETLNAMLERIEGGVNRERGFLADASHELRTPLSLLRAEVELALEAPHTHDELVLALRSIGEEADRLSQLAEDLLLLNRIDEGRLPLRREPILLDELFDGVATRFERRVGEAGRRIETDGLGLTVDVDRLRFEQALGNLVENALRHGSGTVRLFGVEGDSSLEIHVTDEGAGIPAGFAPKAFERFSRATDARSSAGTGLGLAIVKAISEAHGGTVATANRPEGGADICVSLPAERPGTEDRGKRASSIGSTASPAANRSTAAGFGYDAT
jgi:two-component system, OmpR family, sensor kinase